MTLRWWRQIIQTKMEQAAYSTRLITETVALILRTAGHITL